MFTAHQAKGIGYAMSTEPELRFTLDIAQQTGKMSAVNTPQLQTPAAIHLSVHPVRNCAWRQCSSVMMHMLALQHAGVILDPVYSGKAVYQMVQQMQEEPDAWHGKVMWGLEQVMVVEIMWMVYGACGWEHFDHCSNLK